MIQVREDKVEYVRVPAGGMAFYTFLDVLVITESAFVDLGKERLDNIRQVVQASRTCCLLGI